MVFAHRPDPFGSWSLYRQSADPPLTDPEQLATVGEVMGDDVLDVSSADVVAYVTGDPAISADDEAGQALMVLEPQASSGEEIYQSAGGWHLAAPAWSPDGEHLAFIEFQVGLPGRIEETRVKILDMGDGSTETIAVPDAPAVLASPGGSVGARWFTLRWTPDASSLVFSRPYGEDARSYVYAVPSEGGEVVQVTSAEGVYDYHVSCW